MTSERITHELHPRGINIEELVFTYPGGQGSVYRGTFQGGQVGIKVKFYNQSSGDVPQEYQFWKTMQHSSVIQLYDCFWAWNGASWYLVFVMEWCLWDAEKEIGKRRGENRPFHEMELWNIARGLVDALAIMQAQSFAHHNIQLQNIYPFAQAPKIGDFSRAGYITGTIQSMPRSTDIATVSPFLSPELRSVWGFRLYYDDRMTFKSDVYSLGVVLLSLARLELPQFFRQIYVPVEQVTAAIQGLRYSEQFKMLLRSMLMEDGEYRKDFGQLNVFLQGIPHRY